MAIAEVDQIGPAPRPLDLFGVCLAVREAGQLAAIDMSHPEIIAARSAGSESDAIAVHRDGHIVRGQGRWLLDSKMDFIPVDLRTPRLGSARRGGLLQGENIDRRALPALA